MGACVFLSAPASSFVNGHTLFVDGGITRVAVTDGGRTLSALARRGPPPTVPQAQQTNRDLGGEPDYDRQNP